MSSVSLPANFQIFRIKNDVFRSLFGKFLTEATGITPYLERIQLSSLCCYCCFATNAKKATPFLAKPSLYGHLLMQSIVLLLLELDKGRFKKGYKRWTNMGFGKLGERADCRCRNEYKYYEQYSKRYIIFPLWKKY